MMTSAAWRLCERRLKTARGKPERRRLLRLHPTCKLSGKVRWTRKQVLKMRREAHKLRDLARYL